jgi:POT family proton-dependent oligopeptide transporter
MPNDFMQNFDPISILIFTPLLEVVVYPMLRKRGFELRPIARITIGFVFAALCLAYAAIVQHLVYSVGPCYEHPAYTGTVAQCPQGFDGDNPLPQNIHIGNLG